jgi:hypothetical protein
MSKLVRPTRPSKSGLSDPRSTAGAGAQPRIQDILALRGTKRG